jgi:FixJ family two-component response regulator
MSVRRVPLLHAVMMTAHRSTIAVVEDDDSVRKALCRLLRAAGFSSRSRAS